MEWDMCVVWMEPQKNHVKTLVLMHMWHTWRPCWPSKTPNKMGQEIWSVAPLYWPHPNSPKNRRPAFRRPLAARRWGGFAVPPARPRAPLPLPPSPFLPAAVFLCTWRVHFWPFSVCLIRTVLTSYHFFLAPESSYTISVPESLQIQGTQLKLLPQLLCVFRLVFGCFFFSLGFGFEEQFSKEKQLRSLLCVFLFFVCFFSPFLFWGFGCVLSVLGVFGGRDFGEWVLFWFLPFFFFHCEFFWHSGLVELWGKTLKKGWWFCSFVSIPAVKFWLQIPLFFLYFFPERDSRHLFFRDALQRWSFWWWAPTNKCLSSARREGKPIAGETPPALLCSESLGGARGETYIPLCSGITC